ncbi:DUF6046 domain-containing protein [Tenacibaculum maritimum]|uniref:DUF6046 domain-containing protein n=1 Tax=Tenacibaculum maritimum TaxID=107401 RepID=UPI0012E67211|nr:DUF6046 domain-containing protein [Tenacibaculum maritimum]CAA0222510.1 conserved hypothetical protein [Tenacibaculum maritimum]
MSQSVIVNLSDRFKAAFGIYAKGLPIDFAVLNSDNTENKIDKRSFNDYDIAYYGAYDKEADTVGFEYNNQKLVFSDMLTGDDSNIFAPPLIINFSREKKQMENEPSASDDIVVERWSTSPWSIDIRGILIDVKNRNYPKDKISQLNSFFNINDAVKVIGEQFYANDIDSIYFKSINITPVEGFQDTIQFNLTARSIKGVYYTLLKPL